MTRTTIVALCAACVALSQARSATEGDPQAVAVSSNSHAVHSLGKTLGFYREVFGLKADALPLRNAAVGALMNAPGARLRVATLRLPNTTFAFKLTEFSGVDRKRGRRNIPDPGAATLILRVRDLDRVVAAAKQSDVEIVTPSSAPVKLQPTARGSRAILLRDPDGYFVEAEEVSSSGGTPASDNVQSAGMRFALADWDATLTFYRDLLGFKLTGRTDFVVNPAIIAFTGVPPGSQSRALSGNFPGTNDAIYFYEFKDLPRKPLRLRVQDPGAPAMSLRVNDLDGVLARMRALGVPVVSAGGAVGDFTPTTRNVFVEDPNGINIELYEAIK